jgi:hypothetical protein
VTIPAIPIQSRGGFLLVLLQFSQRTRIVLGETSDAHGCMIVGRLANVLDFGGEGLGNKGLAF